MTLRLKFPVSLLTISSNQGEKGEKRQGMKLKWASFILVPDSLVAEHNRYVQDWTLNEIQIPYGEHHKVSSLVKSHQNRRNSVKRKVIWKCQITLQNMKY